MTYKRGDRVRVTHTKANGDKTIKEFTVTENGPHPCGEDIEIDSNGPWEVEVLEPAPVNEPTGVGAVVQFQDMLEDTTVVVVRDAYGAWYDGNNGDWSWVAISQGRPRVRSEGVHL